MISMDYSQVESLRQVSAFLKFIQNPESFAKALKGLQEQLDRYDASLEIDATVSAANTFLTDAKRLRATADEYAKSVRSEVDAYKGRSIEELTKLKTEAADKLTESNNLRIQAGQELRDAEAIMAKAQADRKALEDERAELNALKNQLLSLEKTLNDKSNELKRIIG